MIHQRITNTYRLGLTKAVEGTLYGFILHSNT